MYTTDYQSIVNILQGQHAENNNGTCRIQAKYEAKKIMENGYAFINCSSAYQSKARVDWIEKGQFRSTRVVSRTRAIWIIKIRFQDFGKKLEKAGFSISDVLHNLETNGYTGMYICVQVARGNTPKKEKVESMRIAALRHTFTNYDDIDKRGMDNNRILELRHAANSLATRN